MLPLLGITLVLPAIFRPQSPADEAVQRPLVVNGRTIQAEEVERELIYGVGAPMLEAILSRFLVEHRAQVAALGPDSPAIALPRGAIVEVTDQEVDILRRHIVESTHDMYPTIPDDVVLRRRFHSVDWCPRIVRESLRFNRAFLPNESGEWSDVVVSTLNAVHDEDVRDWTTYDLDIFRQRASARGEPVVSEQSMWWPLFRGALRDAWLRRWSVRTAREGLPTDRVMTVDFDSDGRPEWTLSTADAWREIRDGIDPIEVANARRTVATTRAIWDRLTRDGVPCDRRPTVEYLNELEGANAHCANHELHARGLGYPSFRALCEYRDLLAAFDLLAARDTQADPTGSIPSLVRSKRSMLDASRSGEVKAEFFLVSAFDFASSTWKPDGWNWAKQRAAAIRAELDRAAHDQTTATISERRDAGAPRTWSELLDAHSEFDDGPLPTRGCVNRIDWSVKGRFLSTNRSAWNGLLRESPFTRIENGFSIGDYVFYDQPIGTIQGPFRGQHGYYFAKVISRKAPRGAFPERDAEQRELARAVCVEAALTDYARIAIAEAEIRGLEDD